MAAAARALYCQMPVRQRADFNTFQCSRLSQGQQGRARHSVRAADSSLFAEWRARSDAPYLIHIEISLSWITGPWLSGHPCSQKQARQQREMRKHEGDLHDFRIAHWEHDHSLSRPSATLSLIGERVPSTDARRVPLNGARVCDQLCSAWRLK